jgi:hypothetical protein
MKFGAFDHLDRGIVTTSEQYEERLRLVEAYEESGWFHAFHMTEHHGTPLGMAPCPSIYVWARSCTRWPPTIRTASSKKSA